jgi:hypothetical protein
MFYTSVVLPDPVVVDLVKYETYSGVVAGIRADGDSQAGVEYDTLSLGFPIDSSQLSPNMRTAWSGSSRFGSKMIAAWPAPPVDARGMKLFISQNQDWATYIPKTGKMFLKGDGVLIHNNWVKLSQNERERSDAFTVAAEGVEFKEPTIFTALDKSWRETVSADAMIRELVQFSYLDADEKEVAKPKISPMSFQYLGRQFSTDLDPANKKSLAHMNNFEPWMLLKLPNVTLSVADQYAALLEVPRDCPLREKWIPFGVMREALSRGYTALTPEQMSILVEAAGGSQGTLDKPESRVTNEHGLYRLDRLAKVEDQLAKTVVEMVASPSLPYMRRKGVDVDARPGEINLYFKDLNELQAKGVDNGLTKRLSFVFGSAGTGKTSLSGVLHRSLKRLGRERLLVSPTSAAASRLSELCEGERAHTLAEVIGQQFDQSYSRTPEGFVEAYGSTPTVILDEASMIDLQSMAHLVKILPPGASLFVTGDPPAQLRPIEPGAPAYDISQASHLRLNVTTLTQVYRGAGRADLIDGAIAIAAGKMPPLPTDGKYSGGVNFIECKPSETLDLVAEHVKALVEDVGLKIEDIAIVTPLRNARSGGASADNINSVLQDWINPDGERVRLPSYAPDSDSAKNCMPRVGDPVLHRVNTNEVVLSKNGGRIDPYSLDGDLTNGTTGKFVAIDNKRLIVDLTDGRQAEYTVAQMRSMVDVDRGRTAHTMQGRQRKVVVLALADPYSKMNQRELLGVMWTRAEQLLTVIGSKSSIRASIENSAYDTHLSGFAKALDIEASRRGLVDPKDQPDVTRLSQIDLPVLAAKDNLVPSSRMKRAAAAGRNQRLHEASEKSGATVLS